MKWIFSILLVLSNFLLNSQIVDFVDDNFKQAVIDLGFDMDNDGELTELELLNIKELNIKTKQIERLDGIEYFKNLVFLNVGENLIREISLINFDSLEIVICHENLLHSLVLENLPSLKEVQCRNNNLSELILEDLDFLEFIQCDNNKLETLQLSNLPELTFLSFNDNFLLDLPLLQFPQLDYLAFSNNRISSIEGVDGLLNLRYLHSQRNRLTSIQLYNLPNLKQFSCYLNNIEVLEVDNSPLLETINCKFNDIANLDLSGFPELKMLNCGNNKISALEVTNCPKLEQLFCKSNLLSELNLTLLQSLRILNCSENGLTELHLVNNQNLQSISCSNNDLIDIEIGDFEKLKELNFSDNDLLNFGNYHLPALESLFCNNNNLNNLQCSGLTQLMELECQNNNLELVNIKNGSIIPEHDFEIAGNPNLKFLCVNENEQEKYLDIVRSLNNYTCQINSYCSLIPGGNYSIVEGKVSFHNSLIECEENGNPVNNLKFQVSTGNSESIYSAHGNGSYQLNLNDGQYTITPYIEKAQYFEITPDTLFFDFPNDTSQIQNICVNALGEKHDISVALIPFGIPRPGEEIGCKIIYSNVGTEIISGKIELLFSSDGISFIGADPLQDDSMSGLLSWNFSDLSPFETVEIEARFLLNTPQDIPPIDQGSVISFNSTGIVDLFIDDDLSDNSSKVELSVVNSYDPNDKICTNGIILPQSIIGSYANYLIRFENNGNASATNIIVKDVIDTLLFDIKTLKLLYSSHDIRYKIQNENEVEFIFEDINLEYENDKNDGYFSFKIKTLESLIPGDFLENKAEIYFDYNLPIVTKNAVNLIEQFVSTNDHIADVTFKCFPNPSMNIINIRSKEKMKSLSILNVSRLSQVKIIEMNGLNEYLLDINDMYPGIYIIQIITEKGEVANQKIEVIN